MNQLPTFRLPHLTPIALLILLITSSINCQKSSNSNNSSTSKGGSGTLLAKEVLVAANASGATVDSIATNYQYDGNGNLTGLQQSNDISESGATINTNISYSMTFSNNVISSLTGSVNETVNAFSNTYTAATQINTSFQSSGGHVTSYVQRATTTGSPLVPLTPETANDSALLIYDANGNISTLTIYEINPATSGYQINSQESFTFTGNNLTQTVVVTYAGGIATDTFTTAYQYNGKNSASPLYLIPGVAILSVNDLTQTTDIETGVNPGSVTTTYSTTYNAANQPATSQATVTTTPANSGIIATENITYTYQ